MSHQDNSYERLPYEGGVAPHALPAVIAASARLAGWPCSPNQSTVRVLELGCGIGTNLLSIAALHPTSECVGVDRSPRQIAWAEERARRLGLERVRWMAADIADLAALGLGRFDFIICHGVYSWMPAALREALLAHIAAHLTPAGLAYISYNVMPGWAHGLAIREALLQMIPADEEPAARVAAARRVLGWMAGCAADDPIGQHTAAHLRQLDAVPDEYLFHEYLEADNAPVFFRHFATRLAAHGLQWLCEASGSSRWAGLPVAARAALESLADPVEREARSDLLSFTSFRRSLCVRADAAARRAGNDPLDALPDLHLAAPLAPPERVGWGVLEPLDCGLPEGQTLRAMFPIAKAACLELAARWPQTVQASELLDAARRRLRTAGCASTGDAEQARQLWGFLLAAIRAEKVEAWAWPRERLEPCVDRPRAWPLAGLLAREGRAFMPTARHTNVPCDEADRSLLLLCDGTRSPEEIADALRQHPAHAELAQAVPDRLRLWQRIGWLCPAA